MSDNELDSVRVSYEITSDILQGRLDAKAYSLFINNSSSSELADCVVTLNDQYTAPLKNMEYYYGFWKGSHKFGSNILPAETILEFIFSHDVSNHSVFLNASGERLSTTATIRKIKITCDKGTGEWEFEPGMTGYQISKVVDVLILGAVVMLVLVIVLVLNVIW